MRVNERMKKVFSILLCLCMVAQYVPITAFAVTTAEDGLCEHHPVHTAECGYVAAVAGALCTHVHDEACGCVAGVAGSDCTHAHDDTCGYVASVEAHECHFECAACANAFPSGEGGTATAVTDEGETTPVTTETTEPPTEATEPAPVCTCESEDSSAHAPFCALYVQPENPVCYCVEKCGEESVNEYCDVCYFDATLCAATGEEEQRTFDYVIIESYDPENWMEFVLACMSAKPGDEIVFKGSQSCNVGFTIREGVTFRGGNWTFTEPITNNGNIADGTFSNTITNNATISGGTFTSPITNNATISNGTFTSQVTNNATISGGTFNNSVTNNSNATISGGTFNNKVTQNGTITGGTFAYKGSAFRNNGAIEGGTFNGEVQNSSNGYYADIYISGGTFHAKVTNNGTIYGGTFRAEVVNNYRLYGGVINAAITCGSDGVIYNRKNDSYQFELGASASLNNSGNRPVYCDDHIAIEYSCELRVDCFFCEETCPTIPHTFGDNYICTECEWPCSHERNWWSNGVCTKCQKGCDHASGYSSGTGQCNTCDLYCPHTTMGTNGCAVCGVKAAARVNNVLYLSLREALAAAKSGDTVTAMADYTITEVPDNELNSFMIPEGVTFDGASYTISVASTGPARSVTCLNKGTIIGGSFKMMVINNNGGTIRNGIFHKEVKNNGTVYGGTYYQKLTNTYKVVNLASENSRFVFGENAAFEAKSPVSDAMQCDQHVVAGNVADSGSFACNATIKCILCDTEYGTAYHSVDESGKSCKSCGKALQARIGQMGYENLAEAIALAKSGDTVTALADYTGKVFTIPSGVTLSGGSYSFKSSGAGDYFCLDGGVIKDGVFKTDVNVKSGTINSSKFEAGVTIDENGSVIINYGVFLGESQTLVIPASTVVNGGSFCGKVTNYGKIYRGNFDKEVTNQTAGTIYGGSFHNWVDNSGAIYGGIFHDYVRNAGTIYDGNFESDTQFPVTNSTNGTIYGGYFESELINHGYIKNLSGDPYHFTIGPGFAFNNQQPNKITCQNHMAFDEVCEQTYTCIFCKVQYKSEFHSYNDGGKCTVCDNIASTAVNLRTYYPTLEKALREATSGDSVWHYADRASTITTAITVPAGVTLISIGDIVFTNAVTNNGTISFQYGATGSYTFKGEVINNGEISSGDTSYSINFNGKVTNHGTISHGSFFEVINYGKISNGSFSVVTNEGTITKGMFFGTVTNKGTITGGIFASGSLSNNGVITGGNFSCTVTNNGDISGGSFSKTVTNNARIYNGSFTLDVEHNSGGTIYGGTFSKDIKGSGTIRNIAGDGYTLKLNSGVSCTGPIYCNDHFGGTTTCTAQKTCTLCKAGYGNTGEHSMIYAADEDADTITCRCQHCESQTVVFTLDIPDDAVYGSGKLPAAITTGSYSGTMPVVTFKQGETAVEEPVHAGRYTVTMAWGDKSVSGTFFIVPKSLTADAVTITLSKNSYVYNGQEQTPDVTVTVGETVLTPDIDYRVVVPADVVNVGKKTLNVLFLNNYTSSKTATYEIVKATPVLSWDDQTIVYNGNPAEVIAPTVTLANGENFTGSIQYTYGDLDASPVAVGTYTVTATVPAQDNYNAAEITVQLVIQKATAPEIQWPTATELTYGQKLSESVLTSEDTNGTFMWKDGNAVPTVTNSGYTVVYTPKDSANYDYSNVVLKKIIPLTVSKADPAYNVPTGLNAIYGQTLADVILPEGWAWEDTSLLVGDVGERDFSANYNPDPENYNAKAAKLTVAVSPKDITDAIIGSFAPMTYNGQAQTPEATVTIDGMTVTGTWRDVTNVGDKSVFTANGNFTGSLNADPGMAKKDISGAMIILGERLTYNGEEQTQTVAGVKVDDLDVTFDVSGNRQTNAGDYVLTVTANGNFQGTIATDWSVAKVKLTVTAEDSTVTYGAEDPDEFGWTVTSGTVVDGEELAISISREEGRNAGDYPINIGQSEGDNANYDITFVNGTFTITKAPLIICVIDTSITYGSETPAFGVDGSGFQFQDTFLNLGQENMQFTCEYEQFDDVGTYTVTTSGWESDNYEITYVPGTLTVTPTWLEIIVDSAEKTYGEADPELTYRVDGLLGNDTIGNVMSGKLSRAEGEDVGNYTIVQGSLTTNDNYTVSRFYDADLTINAKAITDADVNLNGLLTYNGKEQTQPIAVTAGITYEVTGNKGTNAGEYELTIKGTGNYTGEVKLNWSINEAVAVADTTPAAKELTYTGEAQALINAGATADGKLVYSLTENGEFTETIPAGTNAGEYMVWYYVVGDDNHSDSAKASVKVTIAKAKATITVDTTAINVTYGEGVTLPTATTNFGTVSCDKTAANLVNAGSYTVTYTVAGTDNYDGDTKTLTVNVGQKVVAEPTVIGTYTYTGSEQTVTLTGVESYMTVVSDNKGTNAGSYEAVITLDGNHKWADGSDGKVQWSIGKAQAEISVNTDPITVTYGETVTLPAATTNFGTVVCDKTAADLVNAGTYTVAYTVADTENFNGDTKTITVTVNPKAITVTADAVGKTYGEADPELTYKVNGLVNGDQLTGELNRVTGENVGSYAIEQNTLTAGSNYTITYTGADLTINAKAITEADVKLNGSLAYTGKEQPQEVTVAEGITYEVTGNKATNVGTYELTVKGTGNYTGEVTLSWTIKETVAVVGSAPTAKDLTYTGKDQALVTGGTTADGTMVYCLTEDGEYTESIPTGNAAGSYTVWYKVIGNDNHSDSAKASVKVTIAKAKATITVDITTINVTYGETVALPAATTNFGTVSCDKTAADLVNAGSYTVTYTVAGTDNYDGDTKTLTVNVGQKVVAEPTVTGTYTYNGNEQTVALAGVESYMNIASGNKGINAGSYEVVITLDGNHKWADGSDGKVQWSIGKAQAEISVNTDPITVTYGETVTLPAATTNFGTVSCDKTAADLVNAGTYTVTYSVAATDNYDGDTKTVTVTVNPKAITVTADAVSKTYGEADPELTYKVNGLVNGDQLTGELNRVTGENVGSYAIEQNTLTAGSNYSITYTGAELTINAKAITEADVKLNGSLAYTGKEQTQEVTVAEGITYEVTGNKATNVGTYELTVKGTGNYTGSVTEKWSIAKATVTITAEDKVIYVGAGLPNLTYSVSGLLAGDELVKVPTLNTNANASIAGSYTITVANADAGDNYEISYVGGTLTVMNAETEVETKIEQTELTEVPDGLKDTEFNTIEAITEELISRILAVTTGYAEKDMVHYDVTLQFSLDDGETWIHATEENFPTEGITVILPYPEGTNARDYEFVVSHMFTVTTQRLGTVAGDVELPKVEETANGIRVTLNGLSPVTVAARYHDHTGGTATCTEKAVCTICGNAYGEVDKTNHAGGTEVKDTKEAICGANGYTGDTYCKGCGEIVEKGATIEATGEHTYGDWKVVKEPTKTTKGEKQRTCSVCGHVDSKEIPVLSDTPATGDNSNIMLYGSMFTMSLAALVVLLLASKKRKQAS